MTLNVTAKFPPVVSAFMQSNARMRHIMGPFRSGKSSGSIVEIPRRASEQRPGPDGFRRTRWMVVRNTMRELKDTTLKTWLAWFPTGSIGYWRETGATYFITIGDIRAEVMFRALDRPEDLKNLLSLEVTGVYFNEVREIARAIIEGVDGRIGQYPAMKDGGPTWYGIWADTNPPEEGSYLYCMYEGKNPDAPKEDKPNNWAVFRQPPAVIKIAPGQYVVNPLAENLENLIPGYYENQLDGKSDEYIKVNLMGEYGTSQGGKPVHPLFVKTVHVSPVTLVPNPRDLLLVTADFGLTPALNLMQQNALGQVRVYDSIATFGMGLERAIETRLLPLLRNKYDGFEMFVTGDPSGDNPGQGDETSCADVFRRYRKKGLGKIKFAYSNNPIHRQGALDYFLRMRIGAGLEAFQVDPAATELIAALAGGYRFKLYKDGRSTSEVEKNDHSHIGESCEYGCMYFERGGRRKAEEQERAPAPAQRSVNHYAMER